MMEIDSPSSSLTPRQLVLQRLIEHGVPEKVLSNFQSGLVAFIKENRLLKPEFVSVILPSDEEVVRDIPISEQSSSSSWLKDQFRECMVWLQWIMFEGDPGVILTTLANMSTGQRGVCGAVWGHNDIAYRCLTCELDPTCAICVPCFLNGNHENHDYSTIYTGGGCCDCGDVTAWKREGFCSNHKGADEIQPLPDDCAHTVGPVFDALLLHWQDKLLCAEEGTHQKTTSKSDQASEQRKIVSELTYAVVEMLLEFCRYSESLLSFVSEKMYSMGGLLDILLRAERQLANDSVKKLHELLLKLLGEPVFKYEFAKAFVKYYPSVIDESIKQSSDAVYKKYPLISTFAVQILTVPTLTPRLVKEMNLLDMFVGCLEDIFVSCAGEDGRIQLVKWNNLYDTTLRVIDDIRFVLSHDDVPKYVVSDRKCILKTWVRLLGFMQGMDPQKRETGIHVEDENDHMHLPFILDYYIALVHSLLVDGAYSREVSEDTVWHACDIELNDGESSRHAKVGRVSRESSVCSATGKSNIVPQSSIAVQTDKDRPLSVPLSSIWLASESLRAIENWLEVDIPSEDLLNVFSPTSEFSPGSNFVAFKRTLSKFRKGNYIFQRFSRLKEPSRRKTLSFRSILPASSGMESGLCEKLLPEGSGSEMECDTEASANKSMEVDSTADSGVLHVLSLSEWPYLEYDVSSQAISLHIPLHRLLSSMLLRGLRQLYGESVVPQTTVSVSYEPLPETLNFFGNFFGSSHPCGFSAFLMEHPVRIRVFCAQVYAGMWKRNGDAAVVSCELYRTTRWSEQSMELDLFLLQCCAALAPTDHFVKRIVERFGLSNYLTLNLEKSIENEPALIQEMLALLIQIVTERRFCGMTTAECLKRELFQRLSVGDATRSQLVKSLPRDLCKSNQIQEILDNIASYSDPSGLKQGMYSLRASFWKELDLYHPRWNPKDLQVAEERYLRVCGVSALTAQCPRWTKIYNPLSEVAKVATCRTALQIVRAVLYYAVFTELTESPAPDCVLLSALHLLALGLDICAQQRKSSDTSGLIPLLAFAGEKIACEPSKSFGEQSLLSLLVLLMRTRKKDDSASMVEADNCDISSFIGTLLKKFAELEAECMTVLRKLTPELVDHLFHSENKDANISIPVAVDNKDRKVKARERQAAILAKMKAEQFKFLASIDASDSAELTCSSSGQIRDNARSVAEESVNDICSLCHDQTSTISISFLVHLQKSRLVSFVENGHPSWICHQPDISGATCKQSERTSPSTSGSDIVSESLQLLQRAAAEFNSDVEIWDEAYLEYLRAQFPANKGPQLPLHCPMNGSLGSSELSESLEEKMYASVWEQVHDQIKNMKSTDIETESLRFGASHKSESVEASLRNKHTIGLLEDGVDHSSDETGSLSAERDRLSIYGDFGPIDCDGVFLSSCGHAVHQGCLDLYLSSLRERQSRRVAFEGGHILDLDQGEFLCPVCRLLANSVLPALPADFPDTYKQAVKPVTSLSHAFKRSDSGAGECFLSGVQKALFILQKTCAMINKDMILQDLLTKKNGREKTNVGPLLQSLYSLYIPGKKNRFSGQIGACHSSIMWDTLKYSLMSVEIAARTGKTSLTPTHSLDLLYGELKSSGEIALSSLIKIVDDIRSRDPRQTFLRFRGIQLLVESISMDHPVEASSPSGQRDNSINAGRHSELAMPYYDIRFWERTSDPILAHDPFSSFMWTLFCLPRPFLSCKESFTSLVHLFYIVCVTQTIATYHGKFQTDNNELSLQDCLIGDIIKFIRDSRVARQYFVSNYIDNMSSVYDGIRRMSFPFLRRCALLSKVLSSLTSGQQHDKSFYGDDMINLIDKDAELAEIQKLEHMYQIPSLDVVLKDKYLRSLVLKWLHHFESQFRDCGFQHYLSLTPAVPFKLMHLPHVYQDLLQRCIKQQCSDCNSTIEEPALCLLCGRLCSSLWKSCCSENRCETHAVTCGAGTGVYLLIRKTTILLQRCARQALWPSPYLDAFGEEDVDLRRGKPLFLNEERYAALCYMVASHGLDRSSKVLRQTSVGNYLMI
uniref:E3 ubiquitin-protein ligase n=1 Tax=Kalanchoe fedtschenkoi TaxID=63787 RepID=A0A7N0RI32_KALFE